MVNASPARQRRLPRGFPFDRYQRVVSTKLWVAHARNGTAAESLVAPPFLDVADMRKISEYRLVSRARGVLSVFERAVDRARGWRSAATAPCNQELELRILEEDGVRRLSYARRYP